ncbi:hypothetical protein [Roseateles oligotrophus]|uniref:Uncharacterized protein n=1 Tax=Roseateles oligotrophus TaxID=1769250 RepID=A0ABT2YBZ6_9BURK|nr:hypothetical protein [Roseateles oligotrophus]MCV2367235.1 hypothetical protein [Roseateles oligotrophus]
MFRLLSLWSLLLALMVPAQAQTLAQSPKDGAPALGFALQPSGQLFLSSQHQGQAAHWVREGRVGNGKWTLFVGAAHNRLRLIFDDKLGLQDILAMDKGQRITLNSVGQERIEYRLYSPDRSFILGSVLYRKDGRWLQGLMRTEAFAGYAALSDVVDVSSKFSAQAGSPESRGSQALAWLQARWQGINLIPAAQAQTSAGDDIVKSFFGRPAQELQGFFGAPLHEMWKGALAGAAAFTVTLASQTFVAGETVAVGTALTAAAPFLVAAGAGVAIGVAAERSYEWARAKNLGGSQSMRDLFNRLQADTRYSQEPAPVAPNPLYPPSARPKPASRGLLDMADKLDRLDQQDMSIALERADQCTRKRDFDCSNAQLAKAAKLVTGNDDKLALASSQQNMADEKSRMAEEARRAAAEAQALALAREQEQARLAQAEQRREAEGGFQWGKALALGGGALLGGVGKLGGEMQAKILTGIVKDSLEGQSGVSNFQASINSSKNAGAGAGAGAGTGTAGNGGNGGIGNAGSGAVSKAAFNAGELACQQEADRNGRPYQESQLDTFCVLASSNACVKRKFGFNGYEAERLESCARMKQSARALKLNPELCSACQ